MPSRRQASKKARSRTAYRAVSTTLYGHNKLPFVAAHVPNHAYSGRRWTENERLAMVAAWNHLCDHPELRPEGRSKKPGEYFGVGTDVWLSFCTPSRKPHRQSFVKLVKKLAAGDVNYKTAPRGNGPPAKITREMGLEILKGWRDGEELGGECATFWEDEEMANYLNETFDVEEDDYTHGGIDCGLITGENVLASQDRLRMLTRARQGAFDMIYHVTTLKNKSKFVRFFFTPNRNPILLSCTGSAMQIRC